MVARLLKALFLKGFYKDSFTAFYSGISEFINMSADASPKGKQAICVVVSKSFKRVVTSKTRGEFNRYLCILKPLLIKGNNNTWQDANNYSFNRNDIYIRGDFERTFDLGSLVSVQIIKVKSLHSDYNGILPKIIQSNGFYELFVFDITIDQLQSQLLYEIPYVPKTPVYVMCLKDEKVCGPLRFEAQLTSPCIGYFRGHSVGCFKAKAVWYSTFPVTLSMDTHPPKGLYSEKKLDFILCRGKFEKAKAIETINVESDEEFFRRVNKDIPRIQGKYWIGKIEERILNNVIVKKLRPEDKERYIRILESIKDQIDQESTARDELIDVLYGNKLLKTLTNERINDLAHKLAQPKIDEIIYNAHEDVKAIFNDAEGKKSELIQEILDLTETKCELIVDVERIITELREELPPAIDRLIGLIDGVKPLLSSLKLLPRMLENSTAAPSIKTTCENCSNDNVEYSVKKKLLEQEILTLETTRQEIINKIVLMEKNAEMGQSGGLIRPEGQIDRVKSLHHQILQQIVRFFSWLTNRLK